MPAFGFTFNRVRILFRLRNEYLYCRITVNKVRCNSDFSINERVTPSQWDAKRQMVKGAGPVEAAQNARLEKIRAQIRSYETDLHNKGRQVTADLLKQLFLGQKKMSYTLAETSAKHIGHLLAQPPGEVAKGTIKSYRSRHKNLLEFLSAKGLLHVTCEEFTPTMARDYIAWLRTEKVPPSGQAHAAKTLELVRKVIKFSINMEWTKYNPLQAFVIKKGAHKLPPYLSDEERYQLEAKHFSLPRLERIRDCFIFCCHTGLSFSDVQRFRRSMHVVFRDGYYWIDMSRIKTGVDFYVPISKLAWSLLQKNGGEKLPVPSNQNFNAFLKEIQDLCGIQTTLTVKVARTTFGVVMLNEMNVPLETVSKMLGHASVKITEKHYARVLKQRIIRDVVNQNKGYYEYVEPPKEK